MSDPVADHRLDPLWLRLSFLEIAGTPLHRLVAGQTGWAPEKVGRVIEEYRRFLFLAMRAGHAVAPPAMVKKVWMLHLDNAQNYWETLGRMITEQPVAGGAEFDPSTDEESRTIASYERIFGAAPPAGIWAANAVPPGWLARLRGLFGSE